MAGRYSVETIFKAVDKMTAPVSRMQKKIKEFTDSAADGLGRASDFMTGLTGHMTTFGAAATGAFTVAVGGLALFVTETNRANNEILNMSKAMGVQYDTTMAMDGILSSMTLNWENFTDLIEEQANKFGELKGAGEMKSLQEVLALTTLSVEKLKKMNPEQQFIAIADSLVKMKDTQKAAFIADEIWSGDANKIIQALRQKNLTVSEVIENYKKYNFYTKEAQQASLDYENALSPLQQSLGTMKSQLAGLIGKALIPYLNKAAEWVSANKAVIQSKIAEYAQKIADGLAWLAMNMPTIIMWAQRIGTAIAIFIALTTVLRTFVLVMTAVNLVLAMNPISLIIIAVVALIAVVVYLINKFFGWEAVLKTVEVAAFALGAGIAALMGPIGWFIMAALLIYKNWDVVGPFFKNLWSGIVGSFEWASGIIMSIINGILGGIQKVMEFGGKIGSFLGFGGGAEKAGAAVSSPQQRTANSLSETRHTSEVTIKDKTGTAQQTKGPLGKGVLLQKSEGF